MTPVRSGHRRFAEQDQRAGERAFQMKGFGAQAVAALERAGVDPGTPATLAGAAALLSNVVNNAAAVMLLQQQFVDVAHAPAGYALALPQRDGERIFVPVRMG